MGNLVSVMVAATIGGIIAVPMLNLIAMQAVSRANLQATMLYESEVSRARRLWSEEPGVFGSVEPHNSDRCAYDSTRHQQISSGWNLVVTCTVGNQTVGGDDVVLSYPQLDGEHRDDDRNGFEDVTGLPTHYDSCYESWFSDGFKDWKCDLGGDKVIPLYSHLYDDQDDDDDSCETYWWWC